MLLKVSSSRFRVLFLTFSCIFDMAYFLHCQEFIKLQAKSMHPWGQAKSPLRIGLYLNLPSNRTMYNVYTIYIYLFSKNLGEKILQI